MVTNDAFAGYVRPLDVARALGVSRNLVLYHLRARSIGTRIGEGRGSIILLSPADVAAVTAALSGDRKPHARNYPCIDCGQPTIKRNARCTDCADTYRRAQERAYKQAHPLPPERLDTERDRLAAFTETVQADTKPVARNDYALWDPADDAYLIAHTGDGIHACALALGRTYESVKTRRHRLRKRGLID